MRIEHEIPFKNQKIVPSKKANDAQAARRELTQAGVRCLLVGTWSYLEVSGAVLVSWLE